MSKAKRKSAPSPAPDHSPVSQKTVSESGPVRDSRTSSMCCWKLETIAHGTSSVLKSHMRESIRLAGFAPISSPPTRRSPPPPPAW